jgi:hypothetical protein
MVNHAISEILLPLQALLLTGSSVWLPSGTVLRHVALQSTRETCTTSLTSLRNGILLGLGYRMRNLLHILPRLLHNWTSCLLLGMDHRISKMIYLKVGMLHRELGILVLKLWAQDLHRCMTQEWGSDKLTRMQKVGPSVASRMLAQKHHLTFSILLHLFQLILDDDGIVNQMLKIWVVCGEQLELDLVIESLEKCILLLFISADIVGGVP